MVDANTIENIITQIINSTNLEVKCGPTISEMYEILSQSSYLDQFNELKEKDLLNPLEEKDMPQKIKELEDYHKKLSDEENSDNPLQSLIDSYNESITKLEDELFQYGRRLIEGYEKEFPVNLDDYRDKVGQNDEQFKLWEWDESLGENDYSYDMTHKLGYMEEKTIENQQNSIHVDSEPEFFINGEGEADIRVNDERLRSMNNYFAGDMNHINHFISHEKYLNRLKEETRKEIKNIDSLMNDSTGLPYNTLLYRGGHLDIHTRVGETISFKGYTSTSFQYETADWYKGVNNFMYLIHAPKGTKGIVGNDERFTNGFMEHEYVLPRNTKMKVIRIDYEKQVCEVVIE